MRRTLNVLFLIGTAWLASTCQSFSVAPQSSIRADPKTVQSGLHAVVQEEQEQDTTATTETATPNALATVAETSSSLTPRGPSLWSAWFPKNRQILKFVEPQTNVTVLLIGSMHYNPTSIRLVETTVEELGKTNQLGSVIIESCDIRWNKTQEIMMEKQKKANMKLAAASSSKNAKTNNNNAAEEFIDSNPNEKDFLGNEMRAAWEVATKYHKPTVLGDQRINITVDALQASLKDTAKDIFLGGPEGWKRSRDEIVSNWKTTIPINLVPSGNEKDATTTVVANENDEPQYLNAVAFFDPRLLISLPVSLVKYPLSFLIKDPVPFGTVFAVFAVLNFYADGTTSLLDPTFDMDLFLASTATSPLLTSPADVPWTDYALSVGIAVLETVVFARLLLKPLLADRNEILAKSVLDQCRLFAADAEPNNFQSQATGGLGRLVRNLWASRSAVPSPLDLVSPLAAAGGIPEEEAPVYVPGSDPVSMRAAEERANKAQGSSSNSSSDNQEGKIVVAVLGMAHCNGVMKLLREQKV